MGEGATVGRSQDRETGFLCSRRQTLATRRRNSVSGEEWRDRV
ncbi:MAG: hypothetical protein WBG32_02265 [Nodosilinea sp.]